MRFFGRKLLIWRSEPTVQALRLKIAPLELPDSYHLLLSLYSYGFVSRQDATKRVPTKRLARTERSGMAKDFGKLSRATSASSVELFNLALWWQRGATNLAFCRSAIS